MLYSNPLASSVLYVDFVELFRCAVCRLEPLAIRLGVALLKATYLA